MSQLQNNQQQFDNDNTSFGNADNNADTNANESTVDNSAFYYDKSSVQNKKTDQGTEDDKISATASKEYVESNSGNVAKAKQAGKEYGDTELNKGLESQAKDEEGTNI